MAHKTNVASGDEMLWRDRKHWMWFPFSFTKYSIHDDRLFIEKGFFKTVSDETLLYRIVDIKLERTFAQKLFGTGTIFLHTRVDVDCEVHLENIKRPKEVKQMLSHLIEDSRDKRKVVGKEFYGTDHLHGPMGMDGPDEGMGPEDFPD